MLMGGPPLNPDAHLSPNPIHNRSSVRVLSLRVITELYLSIVSTISIVTTLSFILGTRLD